jgi:DNA-binding transcriptional regulator YiaG
VTLSAQLKKWRGVSGKGKGLRGDNFTQEEAAGRLGVPLATYKDWEQGRKSPRGLALEVVLGRIKTPPEKKGRGK